MLRLDPGAGRIGSNRMVWTLYTLWGRFRISLYSFQLAAPLRSSYLFVSSRRYTHHCFISTTICLLCFATVVCEGR